MTPSEAVTIERNELVRELDGSPTLINIDPLSDHENRIEEGVWELLVSQLGSVEAAQAEMFKWRVQRFGHPLVDSSLST